MPHTGLTSLKEIKINRATVHYPQIHAGLVSNAITATTQKKVRALKGVDTFLLNCGIISV